MPTRSVSRSELSFARKQKQYRIESDSDDDDENESPNKNTSMIFGGVLATLENDKNSKHQRKTSNMKGNRKTMTSPPLRKLTKDKGNKNAYGNENTPPPRSITTKRSAMRAISPLTTQKSKHSDKIRVQTNPAEQSSHTDSFASSDDEDDDTRLETLSSPDSKGNGCSSNSDSETSFDEDEGEDEESYEKSASTSECEFAGDDEEFIPDDDEEEDESAAMSEFIVDDVSEESYYQNGPNDSPSVKSDCNDDNDDILDRSAASKSDNSNLIEKEDKNQVSNTENSETRDIKSPKYNQISCTPDNNTVGSNVVDDDASGDDETEKVEETPAKIGSPRRTINFDSPESQVAMIVDDEEDHDDILFATIVENDTDDGDTIVLTFDEEEEIVQEEKKETFKEEIVQNTSSETNKAGCNQKIDKSSFTNDESETPEKSKTQRSSSPRDKRKVTQDEKSINKEKVEQTRSKDEAVLIHPGLTTEGNKIEQIRSTDDEDLVKSDSTKKKMTTPTRNQFRQDGEIKRGKWALGAKIGVGSFGEVYVGMNTQTGVLMAVKKFSIAKAVMQDIKTEVELMRSLKHPNIVRYLGAQMDNRYLHIFQEWVPGGSVSSLLSKFGPFSIEVIQSYISQTLRGLVYLHDNDIMHRDIKGSNILVNDEGGVKLADFGASKKLKNLDANMMMSLTVRGTPYFMAPEVFEEKYSAKADVWGIGCVVIQMVTALPPWKDLGLTNPISLFNHIKRHKGPPPMEHPQKETFSKRQQSSWILLKEFVHKCFEQDPLERPSAKELLDYPFVSKFSDGCIDDDESTHYRGLFSPGNEWKKYSSPHQTLSPAHKLSPNNHVARTKSHKQEANLTISPFRRKDIEIDHESYNIGRTPPRIKKIEDSPPLDSREWPAWAKHELNKQNNSKENNLVENKGRARDSISELMDSLALSEDSSHVPLKLPPRRRSSSIGGSTAHSDLFGIKFLESTKSDATK